MDQFLNLKKKNLHQRMIRYDLCESKEILEYHHNQRDEIRRMYLEDLVIHMPKAKTSQKHIK